MLPAPYEYVNEAIVDRGLFTSFQPLRDEGGVRLVCASDGGAWGIGGVSFWISFQAEQWFIASWGPCIYRVPATASIVDLTAEAINAATRHPKRRYFDVDEEVKLRFGLVSVSEEEFSNICGF